MAKILKEGYIAVPEYKLICKHCGTLTLYQKRELRFFEGMDDENLVSYDCPHCHKETTVLANRLPKPCAEREIGEIDKDPDEIYSDRGRSALFSFFKRSKK